MRVRNRRESDYRRRHGKERRENCEEREIRRKGIAGKENCEGGGRGEREGDWKRRRSKGRKLRMKKRRRGSLKEKAKQGGKREIAK